MKKFIFVNDSRTQNNWGCHATSASFESYFRSLNLECKYKLMLSQLKRKDIMQNTVKKFNLKDITHVFVNGEGSLYDAQAKGLVLLEAIRFLKKKKPTLQVFVLNSTYDLGRPEMVKSLKQTHKDVKLFTAREPVSLQNLKRIGIKNAVLQPDFLYGRDVKICEPENYIVLGGNSNYYRRDRPSYDAVGAYDKIVKELLKLKKPLILYSSDLDDIKYMGKVASRYNLQHLSPKKTSWQKAMKILSGATLSISGRYHPTIMSLCGHTPSYIISANNCKMKGTHTLFYENNLNFSKSHDIKKDANKIREWASFTLENYDEATLKVKEGLLKCKQALNEAQIELEKYASFT